MKDLLKVKFFHSPDEPEKVLGIIKCSDKETAIAEHCGWKEILPTFIQGISDEHSEE